MSSTDTRNYSKRFISEFIELYKSLPSLWKIKSMDYSDRNKKNASYRKMVEKLKQVEPEANRDMVTKKINSLRSSYRKERKKVLESQRAGSDVHVPALWYYNLFAFLTEDQPEVSETDPLEQTVMKFDEFSEESVSFTPEFQDEYNNAELIDSPPDISTTRVELNASPTQTCSNSSCRNQSTNHNKRERESDVLTDTSGRSFRLCEAHSEDKHDVFGKHIANKLRCLPNDRRIHLEKRINDAIFEAELEALYANQ